MENICSEGKSGEYATQARMIGYCTEGAHGHLFHAAGVLRLNLVSSSGRDSMHSVFLS